MDNVVALRPEEPEPQEPSKINRHQQALVILASVRDRGVTWRDVAAATGLGHGTVSGILSTLHKSGKAARLSMQRDGSKVYVLPEWVRGRDVEIPSRTKKNWLMDDMASVLRRLPQDCTHTYWQSGCQSCEVKRLLHLYQCQ